jgi:hypothetical protein
MGYIRTTVEDFGSFWELKKQGKGGKISDVLLHPIFSSSDLWQIQGAYI